ncbi:heme A synthase [Methylophilus sp. TWE2]|uniref:COX15/CtaA family protein n=1 Tax=Methylophilus sp. TWE2 TaxID=1662285 RepID=UPI0006709FB7|nr:COX15/CtaA family protein [Methylophilus sp. TWE2]AKR43990.1 cytochrome C oxidase subunit I [Methylophilus sp. TWE2]
MFRTLSAVAAVVAFCVVVLGSYVRLSDAGLGCPDWPGCYGTLTVPQSEAAIQSAQQAYPDKPVEHAKAWKEMAHRYLAGSLGLLVVALAVQAYRQRQVIRTSWQLSAALVVLIVLQALLGMWTVTLLLKPVIVTLHLLGGMTTLAMLSWIAFRHVSKPDIALPKGAQYWLRLALLVWIVQVLLGGWTSSNYAALACTDFPTCHGMWWPDMYIRDAFHLTRALGESRDGGQLHLDALTAIQWVHRLGAFVVLLWMSVAARMLMQRENAKMLGWALIAIVLCQIAVGIGNLLLQLPLVLAVLHNAGAALLGVCLVAINARLMNTSY